MMRRIVIAFALLILPTTVPAAAATGLKATITELTPALPTSAIQLRLQLENSSDKDVLNLRVRFFVSTSPLIGRSQIDLVARGKLLPTYRVIETPAATGLDLSSGASTEIPLATSIRELGLGRARPGVYTFGVTVDANGVASQRSITFLPLVNAPSNVTPLGVVPMITLSAPPQRMVDGTFLGRELPDALLPGGRLRSQLDSLRQVANSTWLIDPVTLEAAQALSVGARINDGGAVRASTNDEMTAAQQWISDLKLVAQRGQVFAIPAADMDIRAALKFGHAILVREALGAARTRVAAVLETENIRSAVQIYGGSISDSTWRLLGSCGMQAVFVSDSAYSAKQRQYTPSTPMKIAEFGSGSVLVIDQVSSNVLTKTGNDFVLRQELAAQLAMTYLEQPNRHRIVTIALPQTWRPSTDAGLSTIFNSSWIAQVPVSETDAAIDEGRRIVVSKPTKRQQRQEAALARALTHQRVLQRLSIDESFRNGVSRVVGGLTSRWFTGNLIPDNYTNAATKELLALTNSIRVVTRGDIVFGGEEGVVPVTIANGLPVPVDVVLHASGLPSVRVSPTESMRVHLNAGKRVSVEIPTRVTGSGTAYLQLWLESTEGFLIGDAVILDIRSAAYARVAGYVVVAAFVTLLLLILVNTVRRVRLRRTGSELPE